MRIFQLVVPAEDVEAASDRLWTCGAQAVEEVTVDSGAVGLRTVLGGEPGEAVARLGALGPDWSVEWVHVADEASESWRDHSVPIDIGSGLVLRPAWLPVLDDGRIEIAVEPGGAFGLGDHPTTRLCASAALRLTEPGTRVLDVGCGSGVLGIVAARAGAERVVAVDISAAAVEATTDNSERNGVAGIVTASTDRLDSIDETFDLVVANVLAPELIALSPDILRLLAADGVVVLSGILSAEHSHVLAAYAPLVVSRTEHLDGWAAVELRP